MPVPKSALSGRGGFVRFTVDDVLAMMRQGILPEDSTTELLNGLVVLKDRSDMGGPPLMHGPKHRACVRKLTALVKRIDTERRHAQIQLPVVCGPDQMPEPDLAIVRGSDADYADRLPAASDVFCVVEAADSSLERDADEKLPIYAAAAVPQYTIINLRSSSIVQYSDPDAVTATYRSTKPIGRGETFYLAGGTEGDVEVKADDLLP